MDKTRFSGYRLVRLQPAQDDLTREVIVTIEVPQWDDIVESFERMDTLKGDNGFELQNEEQKGVALRVDGSEGEYVITYHNLWRYFMGGNGTKFLQNLVGANVWGRYRDS